MVCYNKKYQKLKNINIKTYKNEFLNIEIEIIPKENTFGQIINISNKDIKKIFIYILMIMKKK